MNYRCNLSTLLAVSSSLLLAASCRVPALHPQHPAEQLPQHYASLTDSLLSVPQSATSFFSDPHLQALLQDVLRKNPEIKIAEEELLVAGAFFKIRKGSLLPSLRVDANAGATRYADYTMEGVGNYDTNLSSNIDDDQKVGTNPTPDFWVGLNSSWELDIWGKLRNLKKAARMRYLASQQGLAFTKTMLTAQTALLYYELVGLDKELKVVNDNVRLQEKALEIVEAQQSVGRATSLAVQQFKAQLLSSRAAAYRIQQRIRIAENNLNALTGRYGQPVQRSDSFLMSRQGIGGTGNPSVLLQNRPDLREAEFELAATKADAAAARAAFFPSLNIGAYTAFRAFRSSLLFRPGSLGYQLAGGLAAPIFEKNQIRGQFNISNARQEQAYFRYRQKIWNAYREVSNQLYVLESMQEVIQLKEQEVAALEQGVSISNDLYLTGYATYLEIVSAQKNKIIAQLELIQSEKDRAFALVELYKSAGGAWQ